MLKFSLRDLFWLTVVAAMLCGWWLQCRVLQNQLAVEKERGLAVRRRALVALEEYRAKIATVEKQLQKAKADAAKRELQSAMKAALHPWASPP